MTKENTIIQYFFKFHFEFMVITMNLKFNVKPNGIFPPQVAM